MAKRQRSGVLNRCAGKRFVFNGKFDYGVEESLKAMAKAQQGTVKDDMIYWSGGTSWKRVGQ